MILSQENKILIGIGLATVMLLIGGVFFISKTQPATEVQSGKPADSTLLVRENSHKITTDSAKATLVEFSDFQCPSCGAAYPILKRITQEYAGKVNFVYRQFPLTIHINGFNAALAAEAADQQGKFWEMHDRLFEKQSEWSESDKWLDIFTGYAKDLGLNTEKFNQDISSQQLGERIKADQDDGNKLGVNATPTLYLNGEQIVGVPSYDVLKSKIDTLLAK